MALSDVSACAYPLPVTSTADLSDENPAALVCGLQLRQFGGLTEFSGPISTIRCLDDNVLLRQQIEGPGNGRVLVVDGGGSLGSALIGDLIAGIAAANGWVGFVLNAGVRDVAVLRHMPIGIKALGSVPRRSAKARPWRGRRTGRVRRHHLHAGGDPDERRRRHRRARRLTSPAPALVGSGHCDPRGGAR